MAATPQLFREATPQQLEVAINAILAGVLNQRLLDWEADAVRNAPAFSKNLYVAFTTTTQDAVVITNPYVFKTFVASSDQDAMILCQNFMSANPGYFFSSILAIYRPTIDAPTESTIIGVIYNTSYTDGNDNWGTVGLSTGGPPTGAAGGDLSGTYPNPFVGPTTTGATLSGAIPAALTALDSKVVATYQDVEWELVLFKGNTRYSTTVRANIADGVTPEWQEVGITIAPPIGGVFDFTIDVDIVAGNMRLTVTPATVGWAARTRGRALVV